MGLVWEAGGEPHLPSTYQGSSSNTGLFRVRKRRMTGLPFWTRGFPVRSGCRDRKELWRQNPGAGAGAGAEKNCSQGLETVN